jgi:hypothetical protein
MASLRIVWARSRIGSRIDHGRCRDLPFVIAAIAQRNHGFNDISSYRARRANGAVGRPLREERDAICHVHWPLPIQLPELVNGRQISAIANLSGQGMKNAALLH